MDAEERWRNQGSVVISCCRAIWKWWRGCPSCRKSASSSQRR